MEGGGSSEVVAGGWSVDRSSEVVVKVDQRQSLKGGGWSWPTTVIAGGDQNWLTAVIGGGFES